MNAKFPRTLFWTVACMVLVLVVSELLTRLLGGGASNPYQSGDENVFVVSEVPGLGYTMRPDYSGTVFGTSLMTNNLGLRGTVNPGKTPPAGKMRVICLGDSNGFGVGLARERAFPALLNNALPDVDVINACVPGYNGNQKVAWLREIGVNFSPSAVVYLYSLDDPLPAKTVDERGRLVPVSLGFSDESEFSAIRQKSELEENFQLVSLLEQMARPYLPQERARLRRSAELYNQLIFEQEGWETCRHAIDELAKLGHERQFVVVFVIFPKLVHWQHYPYAEHEKKIETICKELDLPVIQLRTILSVYPASVVRLHPDLDRPNEFGHQLIAKALEGPLQVLMNRLAPTGVISDATSQVLPLPTP